MSLIRWYKVSGILLRKILKTLLWSAGKNDRQLTILDRDMESCPSCQVYVILEKNICTILRKISICIYHFDHNYFIIL